MLGSGASWPLSINSRFCKVLVATNLAASPGKLSLNSMCLGWPSMFRTYVYVKWLGRSDRKTKNTCLALLTVALYAAT